MKGIGNSLSALDMTDWSAQVEGAGCDEFSVARATVSSVRILGVLEALSCGGILLDANFRVGPMNKHARNSLMDGLALIGGCLVAKDREVDRRLRNLIEAVQVRNDVANSTSVIVPRRSKLPLVVRLIRLDRQASTTSPENTLLLIFDPELWSESPHDVLSQAFGLTRAEAEIAARMAAGETLMEIAKRRGVKIGTVRAHLKSVFSKTHTRGQADLTRVLTRLAFFFPRAIPEVALISQGQPETTLGVLLTGGRV